MSVAWITTYHSPRLLFSQLLALILFSSKIRDVKFRPKWVV